MLPLAIDTIQLAVPIFRADVIIEAVIPLYCLSNIRQKLIPPIFFVTNGPSVNANGI